MVARVTEMSRWLLFVTPALSFEVPSSKRSWVTEASRLAEGTGAGREDEDARADRGGSLVQPPARTPTTPRTPRTPTTRRTPRPRRTLPARGPACPGGEHRRVTALRIGIL